MYLRLYNFPLDGSFELYLLRMYFKLRCFSSITKDSREVFREVFNFFPYLFSSESFLFDKTLLYIMRVLQKTSNGIFFMIWLALGA